MQTDVPRGPRQHLLEEDLLGPVQEVDPSESRRPHELREGVSNLLPGGRPWREPGRRLLRGPPDPAPERRFRYPHDGRATSKPSARGRAGLEDQIITQPPAEGNGPSLPVLTGLNRLSSLRTPHNSGTAICPFPGPSMYFQSPCRMANNPVIEW